MGPTSQLPKTHHQRVRDTFGFLSLLIIFNFMDMCDYVHLSADARRGQGHPITLDLGSSELPGMGVHTGDRNGTQALYRSPVP